MEKKAVPPIEPEISETTENYLKRIYILIETKGKARISDIARLMDRSLSSVSEAVKRMGEEGYLNYEAYKDITLTEKGSRIASSVHNNYSTINSLLRTLGIPEHLALLDACSMEHQVSETTIDTIREFVKFTESNPEAISMLKQFKRSNPTPMPEAPAEDDDETEI